MRERTRHGRRSRGSPGDSCRSAPHSTRRLIGRRRWCATAHRQGDSRRLSGLAGHRRPRRGRVRGARFRRRCRGAAAPARPDAAAGARLDAGVPFAELLVETSSHVHAFSCRAQAAEGAGITVHLTDGVHVSQRRSYSRVRLAVATRLLPSGYPEPFYTTTIDVSGGGAQISRDGGIPLASSYEVALAGPLLPAMISAEQCRRVSARRRSACASRRSTHETVSCSSPWCCAR